MTRIAMGVEYDGTGFYGWQRQRQTPTVQQSIEEALAQVADQAVIVHSAGRTDSGVHAAGQVFHFDTPAQRSMRSWVLGGNSNLPSGVSLRWAQQVADSFDSRRSACSRRYRYVILNRWIRPAIRRHFVTWIHHKLDAAVMHDAAQLLIGEHDFTSFRSAHCQALHARRRLLSIQVTRQSDLVLVDVHGNAFLHHMVRNIVGTLLEIGRRKRPASWLKKVLDARDRKVAGLTAPACGLTLMEVDYPKECAVPVQPWPDFQI